MKSLRTIIPVLLSGVLLASAWLGISGLVLLVAFIPLLFAEESMLQDQNQKSSVIFWIKAFTTFLIWNSFATWWIGYATLVGAFFAIVVNSLLMSLVWWFAHLVSRKKGRKIGHLFLFFLWISFEFLHYQWDMSWPWLTLGNGLANDTKLIQWYEYTGVFGGSAWILSVNLLLWEIIVSFEEIPLKRKVTELVLLFILIVFPVTFSLIRYSNYSEKIDPVNIVIAQPNIDPYHDKFGGMSKEEQLNRLLRVSDSLGTAKTDFFIGPETALHEIWENNPYSNQQLPVVSQFINKKYPNAAFVVGATTFRRYYPEDKIPITARYSADKSIVYDAFNSACFISTDNSVRFYHKTKLVSGVEKMPFGKYLRFLDKLVINLGGITGTLGTQKDTVVFNHNGVTVAVPVCYESGYGEYLSGFVKKGASVLFVITNDGWWRNTPGYRQHFSYSRLRAIELRRSIARSANTGISAFIDQRGDVISKSSWWKMTSLSGSLNQNHSLTFYAKHGDYIARIGVIGTMLIIFCLLLMSKKDGLRRLRK